MQVDADVANIVGLEHSVDLCISQPGGTKLYIHNCRDRDCHTTLSIQR